MHDASAEAQKPLGDMLPADLSEVCMNTSPTPPPSSLFLKLLCPLTQVIEQTSLQIPYTYFSLHHGFTLLQLGAYISIG